MSRKLETGRRSVGALLVAVLLCSGCYQWAPLRADGLQRLQPEGVRQANEARTGNVQPAIEPPDEVKIWLQSGEVVSLRSPFIITEVEPGQFRVLDRDTPIRNIALAQVARVELTAVASDDPTCRPSRAARTRGRSG